MTSVEVRFIWTGTPTGITSWLAVVNSRAGSLEWYLTAHHHSWPMTSMLRALAWAGSPIEFTVNSVHTAEPSRNTVEIATPTPIQRIAPRSLTGAISRSPSGRRRQMATASNTPMTTQTPTEIAVKPKPRFAMAPPTELVA